MPAEEGLERLLVKRDLEHIGCVIYEPYRGCSVRKFSTDELLEAFPVRAALESLAADHEFLLRGDVFSKDQIEAYIELKYVDVARWEMTPSPVEYDMYYSG